MARNILGDLGADSEGEEKSKQTRKNGAKKSKERGEQPCSLFFFAPFFSRPFRLSLAPTIRGWARNCTGTIAR